MAKKKTISTNIDPLAEINNNGNLSTNDNANQEHNIENQISEEKQNNQQIVVLCIHCQKEINKDALSCPFCGKTQNAKSVCKSCQKEIPSESIICPFCGKNHNLLNPEIYKNVKKCKSCGFDNNPSVVKFCIFCGKVC
jgi:uncharacterized CHY-type Zn-finger protein